MIDKLNTYKGLTKFIKYLNTYIFRLSSRLYNFSELIEYFQKENSNIFLDKFYTTNNICESLYSKLSFYLPKKPTNNFNFVESVSNMVCNEILNKDKKLYRKHFKTKCLIKIINDTDYNNNLSWISYDIIKNNLKTIINENFENQSENDIEKIINYIIEEDENVN